MQRKCISVPAGTLLYPCSSTCGPPPHLMQNIQPQTGKDTDAVSNDFTNKTPQFQITSVRRHCLILQFLVRHEELQGCTGAVCPDPGSSTKISRPSELWGAPEFGENPTEKRRFEEAPGIRRLGLKATASRRGTNKKLDGKFWVWPPMQTSQYAFRWCLLLVCPKVWFYLETDTYWSPPEGKIAGLSMLQSPSMATELSSKRAVIHLLWPDQGTLPRHPWKVLQKN